MMNDCWDDAVDPFESVAQSGKDEGRSAGLRDGYLEGLNLGITKGWEMGLELGYYKNFVDGMDRIQLLSSNVVIGNQPRRKAERIERCRTLASDISQMINEFPDPETLLKSNSNCDDQQIDGVDSSSSEVVHSMAMLDISSSLERIRIKFKLLCTLLKTKQSFELKHVLNLGDRTLDEKVIASTQGSTEGDDREVVNSESKLSLPIDGVNSLESDW
jgi:hypothetical protein